MKLKRAGIVIQVCWLILHLLMTVSYCLKLLVEYLNKYTTSCLLWFSVLISTSYIWKIYHKYYKPIFYLHLQAQPLQKKVYIFTKIPWQRCITLYMYCNTQITYCTLVKTSNFFFPFHNFIILVHVYYLISALHTEIWIISLD